MKIAAQLQLRPTPEQAHRLLLVIEESNRVANIISEFVFAAQLFGTFLIHRALYATLRAASVLSSQHIVRVVAKVSDAYRRDKTIEHHFREHGSITYDARILSIFTVSREVTIRTIDGRERIAFSAGDYQLSLLAHPTGEADLVYRDKKFYLHVTVTIPDVEMHDAPSVLGVDFGIVNIAADSDGTIYSGAKRDERRKFFERRRQGLQRHRTKSARRRLKKLSKKQRNFQRNENHSIAKHIVSAAAEGTKQSIALENLSGIRARTTVSRKQRSRHSNWSFFQLRTFIVYKALMRGIRVLLVDPRNTSRECPCCGHIDKKNRPSRDTFRCRSCGYAKHADVVGAMNVSNRGAAVNLPMVSASFAR